jgi:serine/threonine-protein kinase
VHRDVKPGNILVSGANGGERVWLTDFGLTKNVRSEAQLTRSGQWVGTVDYMAPEQLAGRAVDGRADVYALGCVLYEAFTGQVPSPRDSDIATVFAHLRDTPPPVSAKRPEVTPAFDDVVARARKASRAAVSVGRRACAGG